MMRIRGMTKSYFHDFSIAASDSHPVATLITLETKTGNVVRSNRFERIGLTANNSCGYEKGIQIIDGRSISINFPGVTNLRIFLSAHSRSKYLGGFEFTEYQYI